jgi:hypothetical protein
MPLVWPVVRALNSSRRENFTLGATISTATIGEENDELHRRRAFYIGSYTLLPLLAKKTTKTYKKRRTNELN